MKIVAVTWMDACLEEAHIEKELAQKVVPIERVNVGYLLAENDKEIIICYGVLENIFKEKTAIDLPLCIPRGCINKITELK